jgi:quinol-cytochrome oxidoreductase complex cytochrome b subunit
VSFLERVDQSIRRSPVWRSIFRNPYPNDERSRAYAVMNNVFLHLHPVRVRQHAVKFAYTFCLGGLSFFLFLVLTVTGVYLMFFYIPSESQAYTNILEIQSTVVFGLLTRNVHRWAAHLMVFFVFLHMMRVFYHGAYKPPREFNWVVGVILLPAGRHRGRPEHAAPVLRAPHHGLPLDRGHLPCRPLLEDPEGRRDLGPAVSRGSD